MNLQSIHVSWRIAALSLSVVVGVVASSFLSADTFIGSEWLIVGLCFAAVGFISRQIFAIALVVVAGLLIGLWRGSGVVADLQGYDQLLNQTVAVVGTVAEDPGLSNDGDVQLRLRDVAVDDVEMGGTIWVHVSDEIEIKRSDVVEVIGRITQGFGNIPAALYRADVVSVQRQDFADVGRDVRDEFADGIRTAITEPEASLASGFLVGQKTALPEKLDNELRLLGLTHIVVASGYNLSILVRYARKFTAKISRFTAVASASFLVFGFMQITGASPSMARASLVTGLSLAAWYYGRKLHPVVLLSFAAGVTVTINPSYAWGDIGWLLSFTSFIGVLMLAPLLHAYFWADKKPQWFRQIVIETMSAQLLTLPIIAYIFGEYSPLSLLANVLILPLIPFAMGLTAVAGAVGVVLSPLAAIAGFPAQLLLSYMTSTVEYLSTWPLASSEISFTATTLVVSYIAIFGLIVFLWRRSGHTFRSYNIVE